MTLQPQPPVQEPPAGRLGNRELTELLIRAYGFKEGVYWIAYNLATVTEPVQFKNMPAAVPLVGYFLGGVELHKQTLNKPCPSGMGVDAASLAKAVPNG